jgi:hypothetical protein
MDFENIKKFFKLNCFERHVVSCYSNAINNMNHKIKLTTIFDKQQKYNTLTFTIKYTIHCDNNYPNYFPDLKENKGWKTSHYVSNFENRQEQIKDTLNKMYNIPKENITVQLSPVLNINDDKSIINNRLITIWDYEKPNLGTHVINPNGDWFDVFINNEKYK